MQNENYILFVRRVDTLEIRFRNVVFPSTEFQHHQHWNQNRQKSFKNLYLTPCSLPIFVQVLSFTFSFSSPIATQSIEMSNFNNFSLDLLVRK